MADEVDVSALAELVRIRRDEDLLRERLEKMEARKDSVSEVVYRRVRSDYESRKGTLESEAREPRERAGREYAKLRGLTSEARRTLEEARLAREEVDFRHELGEFPEEEYATKRSAGDELLAQRQSRVDELARLKERFLEAFHDEEELERAAGPDRQDVVTAQQTPSPPPVFPRPAQGTVPTAPLAPPAAKEPEPPAAGSLKAALGELSAPPTPPAPPVSSKSGPTAIAGPLPPPPVPPRATVPPLAVPAVPPPFPVSPRFSMPAPPDYSPDATVAGPPPERSPAFSPEATAEAPETSARESNDPKNPTLAMNVARILVVQEDGQGPEYVLRPEPNSVGRAPDSTIRLPYPDVSRQHATVFPVDGGWKIVDRGSPNGLFVNGGRVKEHALADGDVIQVGRRKLIFRR